MISAPTRPGSSRRRAGAQNKLTHIRRPANLGFIRNMNRGMALNPASDVVWLNADTLVHGNWLDRLRAAAYQAPDIASVTPWSNNGELMSFPESRVCHPMPSAKMHARLDSLARKSGLVPVEIEVGCGFCLYIKRDALNDVGYLDEVELRRGYGEESDWCLRARGNGWRHLGDQRVRGPCRRTFLWPRKSPAGLSEQCRASPPLSRCRKSLRCICRARPTATGPRGLAAPCGPRAYAAELEQGEGRSIC